jgi:hypothetical protein
VVHVKKGDSIWGISTEFSAQSLKVALRSLQIGLKAFNTLLVHAVASLFAGHQDWAAMVVGAHQLGMFCTQFLPFIFQDGAGLLMARLNRGRFRFCNSGPHILHQAIALL